MGVPIVYRKTAEQVVASFSFTDIAEGSGTVNFLGYVSQSGAFAVSGAMTTSTSVYSGGGNFGIAAAAVYDGHHVKSASIPTSWTPVINQTFIKKFNLPRVINGDININSGHVLSATLTSRTLKVYATASVYKNTTLLGTASGAIMTAEAGASTFSKNAMSVVSIPITSKKFNKDDELKVNVEVWGKGSNTNTFVTLGHDPAGRDPDTLYDNATSQLIIAVPFVIDI